MPEISIDHSTATTPSLNPFSDLWILLIILFIAAAFRLPSLASPGYELDELWTSEVATGRGSAHLNFPVNQLMPAPQVFRFSNASPWWKVWTRMQVTHPPLYFITLRLWTNLFGQGDWIERLFSVIASLAAIAVLFDVARLNNGRHIAIWACLLMAVAPLQIEYARKTRNYVLAMLVVLIATNVLVRIEKLRISRPRLMLLMLAVLAILLTHYFATGAVLGLALYAILRLHGRDRIKSLGMFIIAAVVWAILWGPFFYQQRALFSVDDPSANFVKDSDPDHARRIIDLLLLVPAKLIVPHYQLGPIAYGMALLYVLPFCLLRRQPGLLIWALLLIGIAGVIFALDLSRSSMHLLFVRYTFFACPAIFVLIPAIAHSKPLPPWLGNILCATAVAVCLYFVSIAYSSPATDPRTIAASAVQSISSNDIVAFAATGERSWMRGAQEMMLSRYDKSIPCPVVFLNRPAEGALLARMRRAQSVILFTSTDPADFLPGFTRQTSATFSFWGTVSVMTLQPEKR